MTDFFDNVAKFGLVYAIECAGYDAKCQSDIRKSGAKLSRQSATERGVRETVFWMKRQVSFFGVKERPLFSVGAGQK